MRRPTSPGPQKSAAPSRRRAARRLAAERLEDRRVMSADALGSVLSGHDWNELFDHGNHAHNRDEAPTSASPLARTKIHHVNGAPHEFTWEPVAAELGADPVQAPATLAAALSPLTAIPVLNSNPAASVSVYLDFDGHFEATWGAYSNATTPVYDVDGDLTTFSDLELTYIQDIWARVSEDFSPFNVNVTTVEPSVLAPGVPISAANGVALRVAMGGSYADWFGSAAGGVGYINNFTSTIANTVYVFTAGGGIADPRWAASTASHEAGHGFGLQHQSTYDANGAKILEYNSGDDSWHPIMGSGSSTWSLDPVNTWYNGPNSLGATSFQDDLAVLARTDNGFGYRADDHANAWTSATPLSGSDASWVGTGRVGVNSDIDWFSFDVAAGTSLAISVSGPEQGQNLDAVLELRDSAGELIASANPGESFDAGVIRHLVGRHYIGVKSSGTYGWIGQYTVSVTESLPDIVVTAPTTLVTSELGVSDTFSVVLASRPTANVVIPIESSDPTEGLVSPAALVFTPDNWLVPQTVTVTGADDSEVDGVADYSILFGPITGDPDYELITLSPIAVANADDDTLGWAFSLDAGGEAIYANDMQVDSSGNLYLVGSFGGTVDLDPGPGAYELTADYLQDGYIAKYSSTHELIWVRTIGCGNSGLTYPYGVALDDSGNAYVVGYNSAPSARFGAFTLGTQGSSDAYLTKLDANGTFEWAVGWGGTGTDQAWDVDIDGSGVVHVAGFFAETVDFNPGAATFNRTSSGSGDGFVSRFSSSGNFLSATVLGGAESDSVRRLAADAAGNAYVAGFFTGTAQLGSHSLTSAGGSDSFLAKIDPSGAVEWARQAAGVAAGSTTPFVETASDGSVTFAAFFTEEVHFGPGTPTLTSAGDSDVFLTRYSAQGSLLQVGQLTGTERVRIAGLEIGADGAPHIFGSMSGVVDLDPGPGIVNVAAEAPNSEFALRLTPSYEFLDVTQIKRHSTGGARSFALDDRGNMYVSAQYNAGVATTPTGHVFKNAGGIDSYFLKLTKAPGIAVSAPSPQTAESGASTNITVVLEMPPTADVVIPVATSDSSEGVAAPSSLTFTPANWNVPQVVAVTGVNDPFADGDKPYAIVFGSAASADAAYNGFNPPDVSLVNLDNEIVTTTVKKVANATIPDRGTHTSTLDIAAAGQILDVDVRVTINHNWNADLDVTLIAPDGTRVELFTDVGGSSANFTNTILDDEAPTAITAGTAPFTGRYRPEGNLTALEGKLVAGTWRLEAKDDARGIAGTLVEWELTIRTISGLTAPSAVVTPTSGLATTEDGGTASFTVKLDAQPSANVTIPVSSSDPTEGTVSTASLTFTPANWNTPQSVTITGVDDAAIDGTVAYSIVLGASASTDPDFHGIDPADVAVSNLDNDVPPTKFYVVDDGSTNRTYEYGPTGTVVENYTISSGNSTPRGAASSIAGDRVWVVDANRNVYIYNTSGGLLGSWSAGTLASNATVEGVATNGTDVWIVDAKADRVYRYAGAASRLTGSQTATSSFALNSGNTSPKDIVTDGVHLWVVNDSSTNKVFKYTLAGALVGSWTISGANTTPTGITLDPANVGHLWIVDSGADRVYQYDDAASRVSGSLAASSSFALAVGNTNPQGIADPPTAVLSEAARTTLSPSRRGEWDGLQLPSGDPVATAIGKPAAKARPRHRPLVESPELIATERRAPTPSNAGVSAETSWPQRCDDAFDSWSPDLSWAEEIL